MIRRRPTLLRSPPEKNKTPSKFCHSIFWKSIYFLKFYEYKRGNDRRPHGETAGTNADCPAQGLVLYGFFSNMTWVCCAAQPGDAYGGRRLRFVSCLGLRAAYGGCDAADAVGCGPAWVSRADAGREAGKPGRIALRAVDRRSSVLRGRRGSGALAGAKKHRAQP